MKLYLLLMLLSSILLTSGHSYSSNFYHAKKSIPNSAVSMLIMSKARTKKWTKSPNEMILAMPSENFLIVDTKNECGKLSGSYHFTEYREDGTIVNEVDALKITPSKQQSDLLQIEDISIFNTKSISYGYSSLARQCVFSSAYNNGTNFTYEGATFSDRSSYGDLLNPPSPINHFMVYAVSTKTRTTFLKYEFFKN